MCSTRGPRRVGPFRGWRVRPGAPAPGVRRWNGGLRRRLHRPGCRHHALVGVVAAALVRRVCRPHRRRRQGLGGRPAAGARRRSGTRVLPGDHRRRRPARRRMGRAGVGRQRTRAHGAVRGGGRRPGNGAGLGRPDVEALGAVGAVGAVGALGAQPRIAAARTSSRQPVDVEIGPRTSLSACGRPAPLRPPPCNAASTWLTLAAEGGRLNVRPVLKPALRRLWRDRGTLQLGVDPRIAVLLSGLDTATVELLDCLDGTRDLSAVLTSAANMGVEPERAQRLLDLLLAAGALDDAAVDVRPLAGLGASERDRLSPDLAALSLSVTEPGGSVAVLAARRRAVVEIVGAGRVGAPLGAHLAAAGVGHVAVNDDAASTMADVAVGGVTAADAGAPRSQAARTAIRRASTATVADPLPVGSRPHLVVLAPVGLPSLTATAALVDQGIAHLLVHVSETVGVLGPLVLPGSTSCVTCADLHRTARDPGWPLLRAQLSSPGPYGTEAVDGTLAAAAAAHAALQALDFLDALLRRSQPWTVPATADGTLELARSDWRWRRHSWPPHPQCRCRQARWLNGADDIIPGGERPRGEPAGSQPTADDAGGYAAWADHS